MKNRVLVINQFANPNADVTGGTRHVELFAPLSDWAVTIIAGRRNFYTKQLMADHPMFELVPATPYSANGPSRVLNWLSFSLMALLRGLRLEPPDVVYASSPHLFGALTGWALAKRRRAAFILEIRDLWPKVLSDMGQMSERSIVYRALERLERFLYRQADAIVALSEGVRTFLVATQAIPRERVQLIPNGTNTDLFAPCGSRDELRAKFGFEGIVAAYTGAHGPANGLDLLLEAAKELRDEQPDLRFILLGDGLDKPALQERARREELHNVEFWPAVPRKDVAPFLNAIDIGVHVLADVPLFRYGVSPNKVFDYMSAELPVVTNTPGEVAELVERAKAGIAVGPDGIAVGVRALVTAGADERRRMGQNGRQFVTAHHSRAVLSRAIGQLLDATVPSRRRSSG
jgi:glycosyltransferase involved in cell wall biosynthesis